MTDRTPPQDQGAEMAALGGMLLDTSPRAIEDVTEIIDGKDFYQARHEWIYDAIYSLYIDRRPADAVTVSAELTRRGLLEKVGGSPYLHTLMASIATPANAAWHAEIVRDHAVRRRLIEAGTRITAMGYETTERGDLPEIVDRAQALTHGLSARRGTETEPTPTDDFAAMLEEIENGGAKGLPTGIKDLDDLTGGLHPGQMVIIAARPAVGKSVAGAGLCCTASIDHGLPSAFFSLEMPRRELMRRITSREGRIPLHHLLHGNMTGADWDRAVKAKERISRAPLYIDDDPNLTVMRLRAKARRLREQRDVRLIVVDYLQLMTAGTSRRQESRQQEVSEMSRAIKLLAKELEIPIVAIAQLNRGPEQRADKRPMMSDLRESGSLEQDADVVILLHREDAYERESPRAGEADLIVAKHRNGPTAVITVAFQGHYSRFVDMARSDDGPWSPSDVLGGTR